MANSLFGPKSNPNRRNEEKTLHPVLEDYQAALRRGDQRAREAQQLLSVSSPQQLRQVALNMLQARGLTPEAMLKKLGFH